MGSALLTWFLFLVLLVLLRLLLLFWNNRRSPNQQEAMHDSRRTYYYYYHYGILLTASSAILALGLGGIKEWGDQHQWWPWCNNGDCVSDRQDIWANLVGIAIAVLVLGTGIVLKFRYCQNRENEPEDDGV